MTREFETDDLTGVVLVGDKHHDEAAVKSMLAEWGEKVVASR